ncbi:hypothetical protein AAFC00_001546 [Neodothiora populina]|uniref:DUF7137 domain-containing protein n=1 Tax=Neodothiora populina TaxID=2781224 RepID=A0ABR3PPN4_9PEZI
MRPSQLLSIALLSTTISAWSMDSLTENKAVQRIENLFRRQDQDSSSEDANVPTATFAQPSKSNSGSASASASATQANESKSSDGDSSSTQFSKASATDKSSAAASSGASSAKPSGSSGSGTAKSTGSAKTTGKSTGKSSAATTKTYGNSVGFGGISMLVPAATDSSSYYKIGDNVTFAWNYTSLSVTPTAVDILATCTANSATYTLAMNQTIGNATGAVTWDTRETGTMPLLTETYTLMIHDAAIDVTQTAQYGHLAAYTQHVFAMYTPQPYKGLNEGWKCVTCSGAMSNMERQTMGFMLGMMVVAITTFTIFAGNFGVL